MTDPRWAAFVAKARSNREQYEREKNEMVSLARRVSPPGYPTLGLVHWGLAEGYTWCGRRITEWWSEEDDDTGPMCSRCQWFPDTRRGMRLRPTRLQGS